MERFWFQRGHEIPHLGLIHNLTGEEVESDVWLNAENELRRKLRQSSVHIPCYGETLVLIEAERLDLESRKEASLPPLVSQDSDSCLP